MNGPTHDTATPRILLLDEPTAALDLAYQLEVAALLRDLQRRIADRHRHLDPRSQFRRRRCAGRSSCLKDGAGDRGRTDRDVLTPANIRALYGVEADVQSHAGAGHLVVVPIAPRHAGDTRRDHPAPDRDRHDRLRRCWRSRRWCWRRSSARPRSTCGGRSTGRCPLPTTSTRRSSSSRGCRARSPARSSARRWPRPASSFRDCCATRSPRRSRSASRRAPRSARCWRSRSTGRSASPGSRRFRPPAFVGAAGAVTIVYALARAQRRGLSTDVLLLAGVTLNAFFSALILCVQYFADFADAYRTLRWLMGDLDVSSYQPIVTSLPLLLVAFAVFAWLARPLNLLSLGTDSAETRGLAVTSAQRRAFFSASLATGAAVSIGGPVGLHRHHRAAPRAIDRRLRPPRRAAGIGALRRRVPGRMRRPRADAARAGRDSGRRHHGVDWRAVLSLAAGAEGLISATCAKAFTAEGAETRASVSCAFGDSTV